jgi:hypothetical protein
MCGGFLFCQHHLHNVCVSSLYPLKGTHYGDHDKDGSDVHELHSFQ